MTPRYLDGSTKDMRDDTERLKAKRMLLRQGFVLPGDNDEVEEYLILLLQPDGCRAVYEPLRECQLRARWDPAGC